MIKNYLKSLIKLEFMIHKHWVIVSREIEIYLKEPIIKQKKIGMMNINKMIKEMMQIKHTRVNEIYILSLNKK